MAGIYKAALAFVLVALVMNTEAGPLEVRQENGLGTAGGPTSNTAGLGGDGSPLGTSNEKTPVDGPNGTPNSTPTSSTGSTDLNTGTPDTTATPNNPATGGKDVPCNQAILKVISLVAATSENAKQIKSKGSEKALAKVADALGNTTDAIKSAAQSIAQKQKPSAEATGKVTQGMSDAKAALATMEGSDPNVAKALQNFENGIEAAKALQTCGADTDATSVDKGTKTSNDNGDSGTGADIGTSNGADSGTVTGTGNSTVPGADNGTSNGTGNGAVPGADSGTSNGAVPGTDNGTGNGAVPGADSGTSNGAVSGTDSGTGNGAVPGADNGSGIPPS